MAVGTWFATEFDEPAKPRGLPALFASGVDSEVLVADRMARGVAILGRVQGVSGAVVLKVRTGGRAVRVRVDLHVDGASQTAWSRVAAPTRGVRELPRLVMVRAQGTDRVAALIRRQHGRLRMVEAHAWVEFDLGAEEIGADELLIVEVAEATLPAWASPSLSALAAVGVRINQVEVTALDDVDPPGTSGRVTGQAAQHTGLASAGGLVGARGRGEGPARTGFVVVNADATSVRCRLRVTTASVAPSAIRDPRRAWMRRGKAHTVLKAVRVAQRGAGYALFEASPFTGPPRPEQLRVRAANLVDGGDCRVAVTTDDAETLDVVVTRTTPGPVLIGVDEPDATAMRRRVCEVVCRVVELEWS
ncbi:hypothetical protein [Micromonospora sp. NPDC003816]|uniref:hypothetical protein n=1 Tax=Micromonospora sp. NPDC003816 TaxID=3364224 RepID=UPI0036BC734F